jgi:ABC-type amino acid transport substrate-binding protein
LTPQCWASSEIELSASQQEWLKEHPQIVWGLEKDYPPYMFINQQQQPAGLSYDLLQMLQSRTGINFKASEPQSLNQLLEAAKARQIDIITSVRPTPERAEYLAFTAPYVEVPVVLALRSDQDSALGLKQMTGKAVAVSQGYSVEPFVRKNFPEVQWQAMANDLEGLQALLQGKVDGAVIDIGSASDLIKTHNLQGLQLGDGIGWKYELSIGYRKDWPELGAILEAGLQSLSIRDRKTLFNPWLSPEEKGRIAGSSTLEIIALLALLLAAGLLILARWRRR